MFNTTDYLVCGTITCLPSTCQSRPSSKSPDWSRLDPFIKLGEAYEHLCRNGGGLFTLRLTDGVQAAARRSGDAARFVSRRIQAELRRSELPAPRFAFCLEVTQDGRDMLHVHGVILLTGDQAECKLALRRAGGLVKGPAAARQLDLQPPDPRRGGAKGWSDYTRKAANRTRKVIGNERIIYIERRLLQVCARGWDDRRRSLSGRHS